jgi:hypothetical protein
MADDGSYADDDYGSYGDEDVGERRDTETGTVRVSVRIRPPTEEERSGAPGGANCVETDGATVTVFTKRVSEPHPFSFDFVFAPTCSQDEVCFPVFWAPDPVAGGSSCAVR